MLRRPLLALAALAPVLAACPGEDPPKAAEPTYANVAAVLQQSCTFGSSCHGGEGAGRARLNLAKALASGDARPTLLAAACQYSAWKRVDPGAPERSWLITKIAGAHAGEGKLAFTPDPSWKPEVTPDGTGKLPASDCPLTENGALSFGYLMPYNVGAPAPLSSEDIELVRAWIQAGAPGPR